MICILATRWESYKLFLIPKIMNTFSPGIFVLVVVVKGLQSIYSSGVVLV